MTKKRPRFSTYAEVLQAAWESRSPEERAIERILVLAGLLREHGGDPESALRRALEAQFRRRPRGRPSLQKDRDFAKEQSVILKRIFGPRIALPIREILAGIHLESKSIREKPFKHAIRRGIGLIQLGPKPSSLVEVIDGVEATIDGHRKYVREWVPWLLEEK